MNDWSASIISAISSVHWYIKFFRCFPANSIENENVMTRIQWKRYDQLPFPSDNFLSDNTWAIVFIISAVSISSFIEIFRINIYQANDKAKLMGFVKPWQSPVQ